MIDTMTNFQFWKNRNINWMESKINKVKLERIPILLWFIMMLSLIIFQTECKETKTRNLVDECQEGYYLENGICNKCHNSWKTCSEGKGYFEILSDIYSIKNSKINILSTKSWEIRMD